MSIKQIKTRPILYYSCATAPSSGDVCELQLESCRVGVKGQEMNINDRLTAGESQVLK